MSDFKRSVSTVTGSDGLRVGHGRLLEWVGQIATLARPDRVVWCDGSQEEYDLLCDRLVDQGTFVRLNPELRPRSYLARSHPGDVARVESRTFICSNSEDDAGPTNNWLAPDAARTTLTEVFDGSMAGRTMYVVPFSMGPVGSPFSVIGVELTDSPYVVVNMHLMTRVGSAILAELGRTGEFVPCVHSVGYPLRSAEGMRADVPWPCNDTKYICHFPETREVWSFGSGYGGNALLGKKSLALRIASVMGHDNGWLAEHMLLLRLINPSGEAFHLVGAFPSACGKTNLAMLRPTLPGWTVETLGDDIVWMRQDDDGYLRAINPEAGFFGVAPGTSMATNPAATQMVLADTIFTNVALTDEGDVWWEGLTPLPPEHLIDWTGKDWRPGCGRPAAHPNSRFTVAAGRCPCIAPDWQDPAGVRVHAVLLGGRRTRNVPLVTQARNWEHGVFLGATMGSEQTAAAEGEVGSLRRDPFAMLPFCGYNMADHWAHWLALGERLGSRAPLIFSVNWFRKDSNGDYLWPGFGENSRVLAWIADRIKGTAHVDDGIAGLRPRVRELELGGLAIAPQAVDELFAEDRRGWQEEAGSVSEWFDKFGTRIPDVLMAQLDDLRRRVSKLPA